MLGAKLHLASEAKFKAKGAWKLVCELRDELEEQGKRPYVFPSGGSNTLGSWGYIEAVREMAEQARDPPGCPCHRLALILPPRPGC
jgi:1-aminocyclopropane-1-carboxylate deaminase/D-cysteine desulfhydrase-like pyridoxal-dependent ACC family enzyme